MRKAREAAKASGKKPSAKKKIPTWVAPDEFKPAFIEWTFKTEKDGMPGGTVKAVRYQGRYDVDADDSKKFNMLEYDVGTVIAMATRFALTQFHATGKPTSRGVPTRLEGNTIYRVVLRVSKRKADDTLMTSIKTILVSKKTKTKVKLVELDKKDPHYRKIRKALRYLPAAFRNLQPIPKKTKRRKSEDDED